MDINQMRYFIEICRAGSISKAADNLYLSQQGLSGAVRRLEKEIGCDLFYRKAGGLVLTGAGEVFRAEAEAIVKKVDYIMEYCASMNSRQTTVSVACTTNIIVRLPVALQMLILNQTQNDFTVDFCEDWTSDCENLVSDGLAAFGIVYGDCDTRRFDVLELDVLQQVFIVNRRSRFAAKDTISIADLDGVPLIVAHDRCRPGMRIRQLFKEAGAALNVAVGCDRPRQIIDLVSHNPHLAARIIAGDITSDDLSMIKPLVLEDDPYTLPVCLISKKGHKLSMAEKYFQHLATNCYSRQEDSPLYAKEKAQ